MNTATRRRLGVLVALLSVAVYAWLPVEAVSTAVCPNDKLCVAFLDVGQGDATFIQSPSGVQVLVDGGRGSQVLNELSQLMEFWDRELDYVIATHPDADHVGGLGGVFDRYMVRSFMRTENESDTNAWESVKDKAAAEGAEIILARRGQVIDMGSGVKLEVLFPDSDMSNSNSNAASIILRLTYGGNSMILTGDAPKGVEEYLVLIEGENLASDVLKVGHHGSRTSTSETFLAEVDPNLAVISVGANNQYGHPHVEVTDLLFNYGVTTYSTDESGRVVLVSDGSTILKQ